MATKPLVFVGSSVSGLAVARAVNVNLNHDADVNPWELHFKENHSPLEELIRAVERCDFAALVLSPDDLVQAKGDMLSTPRDNVVFELGLFMGRLGRERAFAIVQKGAGLKIPTDLLGITLCSYPSSHASGDINLQVNPACLPIIQAVQKLGPIVSSPAINPRYDSDLVQLDGTFQITNVIGAQTVIIVIGSGYICELLDRPVAGRLRDEIDRRGGIGSHRRAVIVTYAQWLADKVLHDRAVISIGSRTVNGLTATIEDSCKAANVQPWPAGSGFGLFQAATPARAATLAVAAIQAIPAVPAVAASPGKAATPVKPAVAAVPARPAMPATAAAGVRVALWGGKAMDTRSAVEGWADASAGLVTFLRDHVKWS